MNTTTTAISLHFLTSAMSLSTFREPCDVKAISSIVSLCEQAAAKGENRSRVLGDDFKVI